MAPNKFTSEKVDFNDNFRLICLAALSYSTFHEEYKSEEYVTVGVLVFELLIFVWVDIIYMTPKKDRDFRYPNPNENN